MTLKDDLIAQATAGREKLAKLLRAEPYVPGPPVDTVSWLRRVISHATMRSHPSQGRASTEEEVLRKRFLQAEEGTPLFIHRDRIQQCVLEAVLEHGERVTTAHLRAAGAAGAGVEVLTRAQLEEAEFWFRGGRGYTHALQVAGGRAVLLAPQGDVLRLRGDAIRAALIAVIEEKGGELTDEDALGAVTVGAGCELDALHEEWARYWLPGSHGYYNAVRAMVGQPSARGGDDSR